MAVTCRQPSSGWKLHSQSSGPWPREHSARRLHLGKNGQCPSACDPHRATGSSWGRDTYNPGDLGRILKWAMTSGYVCSGETLVPRVEDRMGDWDTPESGLRVKGQGRGRGRGRESVGH